MRPSVERLSQALLKNVSPGNKRFGHEVFQV